MKRPWSFAYRKLLTFQKKIQYRKNVRLCRNFQRLLNRTCFVQLLIIDKILQKKDKQNFTNTLIGKKYQNYLRIQIQNLLWVFAISPFLEKEKNHPIILTNKKSATIYESLYTVFKESFVDHIIIIKFSNFFSKKNKYWFLSNVLIEKKFFLNWLKKQNEHFSYFSKAAEAEKDAFPQKSGKFFPSNILKKTLEKLGSIHFLNSQNFIGLNKSKRKFNQKSLKNLNKNNEELIYSKNLKNLKILSKKMSQYLFAIEDFSTINLTRYNLSKSNKKSPHDLQAPEGRPEGRPSGRKGDQKVTLLVAAQGAAKPLPERQYTQFPLNRLKNKKFFNFSTKWNKFIKFNQEINKRRNFCFEFNGFLILSLKEKRKISIIKKVVNEYIETCGLNIKIFKNYSLRKGINLLGWFFYKKKSNFFYSSISSANLYSHQKEIKKYLNSSSNYQPIDKIVYGLNRKILNWKKFYNCSRNESKTLSKMNNYVFWRIWYWIKKRHLNKSSKWLYTHYWKKSESKKWTFSINNETLIFYIIK